MIPLFSFVAYSNTGKTTYIEKLIGELKARGLRVAAIKHDAHEFEVDKEGKDSWRFARSGADVVAISSQTKCAVMQYRYQGLDEIRSHIRDVDIIIAEGWHTEAENKILFWRPASGKPPKLSPAQCLAVVSDERIDSAGVPVFPVDDASTMADFLLDKIKTAKT